MEIPLMRKHGALSVLLLLALLGFSARHAFADIYKYVNEEGETSFADNLESVPQKYRATAVNMTPVEDRNQVQPQQLTQMTQTQPQAKTEQSVQPGTLTPPLNIAPTQEAPRGESAHTTAFTTRLLMTTGVAFLLFIILFALNKTDKLKGREKVLQATRIGLVCIFLIYLVIVHGKDAVHLFTMAGNTIESVQEKQAQRGKKAGEAIKALNQLMEEAGKQPPPPDQGEEKGN
jgi:hypothetical protein